jgi:DNA repair photolyase
MNGHNGAAGGRRRERISEDMTSRLTTASLSPEEKARISRRLQALNCFDPWNSPLCTCGPKLSLDAYAGCGNECFYCYAASYNWRYWGRELVRPKTDLIARLQRDLRKIAAAEDADFARLAGMWVALSNSSDPYPQLPAADEADLRLTRRALELLRAAAMRVLITTKSPLVVRDLDVLDPARSAITMTITTLDADLAAQMEPLAPSPQARLAALSACAGRGFGVACRLDPVIPGLNDDEEGWERLCGELADAGVRQVISSTLKLQPKSARHYRERFPDAATAAMPLYGPTDPDGYRRMHDEMRRDLMTRLKQVVEAHGMGFAVCREGMPELNTGACDGRGLAGGAVND